MTLRDSTQDIELKEGLRNSRAWGYDDPCDNNKPLDLTGWAAVGWIKDAIGGTTLLTLTDANGRIVLGGTAGTVQLEIAQADWTGLFVTGGETKHWRYQIALIPPGEDPEAFRDGIVSVTPV